MADFITAWNPPTALWAADWVIDPPGMAVNRDLETAVIISLMTDASAWPDDVLPDGTDDRRGWWADRGPVGDAPAPPEGPLGSRLWLLVREKSTEDTRSRAELYAAEALEWVTRDGVAARVDVRAAYLDPVGHPPGTLGLWVRILRWDGTIFDARFAWAWEQLFLAEFQIIPATPAIPAAVTRAIGSRVR